ncbi:hypothetical protein [Nocardia grenadensis]
MTNNENPNGRVAVVTGASSGIGAAVPPRLNVAELVLVPTQQG